MEIFKNFLLETISVQPDTEKKPVFLKLHDELVTKDKSIEIKHANLFQNLLLGVSIVLILGQLYLHLT